jgi:hypothetical protein
MADGADWWAFYLVALSGTLLVVCKSVRQSMTFLFSPEVQFSRMSYLCLSHNAFLNQFMVFCEALFGLMV